MIGAIKYGCYAHVVKIIKKHIYSSITGLQPPTLLKIKTLSQELQYVKTAKAPAFLNPYFPVFEQNWRMCPNTGKHEYDSLHITENMDQRIYSMKCSTVQNFSNGLNWKHNLFREIEKFHQPSLITPLLLGIKK